MRRARQRGFTYVGLLFAVAIMAVAAAGAGIAEALEARRARERELLFIGQQFRAAIGSYVESTPGADRQYPASLQDLLLDRRGTEPRRHLRQIYADPFTRKREWGLVQTSSGAIIGIHSRAPGRPLKQAGFDGPELRFAGARDYAGWQFIYEQGYTRHMPAIFDKP